MKVSKYIVVPAVIAVGLFAVSTAYAGNLGDENGNAENCECDENGNPILNGSPPAPEPPHYMPVEQHPEAPVTENPGGGGKHGKNGEGKVTKTVKGGGGGGHFPGNRKAQVVCVIDGQIVYVRRVQDCTYQPKVVVYHAPRKAKRVSKKARVVVEHLDKNGGDSYVVVPQVQYYSPASPAAVMQARKRAAKAASQSYGHGYYVQPQVVVKQYRKKRKVRYAQPIYMPAPDYSGVVIHYGPLVTKGGAY